MRECYFDKIRKGTGGQLVVIAYVSDEFAKKADIRVKLGKAELNYSIAYAKMSVEMIRRMSNPRVTKTMAIIIDAPELLKAAESENSVITVETMRGNILYKTAKGEAARRMSEVNSDIQAVIYEGEYTIIKGWALDASELELEVLDAGGKKLTYEMNRLLAPDVLCSYPEYEGTADVGFFIKVKTGGKSCSLVIKTAVKPQICQRYKVAGVGILGKFSAGLRMRNLSARLRFYIRRNGVKNTAQKVFGLISARLSRKNIDYNRWIKKRLPSARELNEQRSVEFEYRPKFSILVPLYESDKGLLDRLVESVKAQTYDNWELCLSDGSRDKERLREHLKPYLEDKRIRLTAEAEKSLGISENTNQAYDIATGDYIVLGDHDDVFTPDALYECAKALNEDRDIELIYSDEDKVDEKEKRYFDPNFKPDFNIDLLRSTNYICHMFVAKKSVVEKAGSFNPEYDGAQDYDFILRCVEQAEKIHHIPKILYHWRAHVNSTASAPEAKLYAYNAGKNALQAHYDRLGMPAVAEHSENLGYYRTIYRVQGNPLVSIVIPNKDHIEELKKCMSSIDERSVYRNYEYIIVENNSTEDRTFKFYEELSDRKNVHVLYWQGEFNYSAINNYGARNAKGEYLLLLNNDTEMINADCLEQLLACCQREDVGAVGAKLLYEDGSIQHAGVIVGLGGIAGHAFSGVDETGSIYQLRSKLSCDYSAVTAACLMTKKSDYEAAGGLDESFKVAFNDVDYCLKLREMGKLVVYNANARLYHYESKSRGADNTPEKLERFSGEIRKFEQKWPDILLNGDPYYNVNLTLTETDYGLKS